MIESFLTENMLERGETAISDYLRSGESDFSNIWKESWTDIKQDLINRRYNLRNLCKQLEIQSSVTKTDTFTGNKSDTDYAQRMRLVLDCTAITGTFIFNLQGTNDNGDSYETISLLSDDGSESTDLSITEGTKTSYLLSGLYKNYRLNIATAGTTITYSAYLIEEIFTSLHRDKTRANIYRTLMSRNLDYVDKYNLYRDMYMDGLENGRIIVDYDESGSIEEEEGKVIQQVVLRP